MEPDFWIERWRQNQIGFHQHEINTHLQTFWGNLKLDDQSRIFVPLCGKSRDLLWLRAQGHEVLGIEISPIAVGDFFQENNLTPQITQTGAFTEYSTDGLTLLLGDFFDLRHDDLKGIGGIYDRASLVALPPEMRARYARHLIEIKPPAATTLLVTMEYDQVEMQGPPFAVHEDEVRSLYQADYRIETLFSQQILDENPQFRNKGLSQLTEKVFQLHR
ncbi:thiopurine S-methyltransferase [bacterium endosymbiont of Escarpia laminata]|nr:MAG: thiopurine S-methyltransferase [bacterium endosymbiont of Escarpia laminata]RLJ18408.1 MAG: thiopurine S-methyltransferase [bacterium endosymbiont of Escarpia laminata]